MLWSWRTRWRGFWWACQYARWSEAWIDFYLLPVTKTEKGLHKSFADGIQVYEQGCSRWDVTKSVKLNRMTIMHQHESKNQLNKASALWFTLDNHAVNAVMPSFVFSEWSNLKRGCPTVGTLLKLSCLESIKIRGRSIMISHLRGGGRRVKNSQKSVRISI